MKKDPTAFVSYSWEGEEHKNWVLALVSKLFENGIKTAIDVFETQTETVNLYNMMIKNIREKDYTILVLTENYAEKADDLQGGVGFETNLLISSIMDNFNKIIPIVRTKGNKSKAIPFYLRGVYYIDFSNDEQFEAVFKELLHRIYKVDQIEEPKLGVRPDLKPKKIESSSSIDRYIFEIEDNTLIPNLLRITDMDKNKFMKESYTDIINGLHSLLKKTNASNSNFEFEFDTISPKKVMARIYLDGTRKYSFKAWLENGVALPDTINLSYGYLIKDSDDLISERITCELDKENKLGLKMNMNFNKNIINSKSVTLEIWRNMMILLKVYSCERKL